MFSGCRNVKDINLSNLNTKYVINMKRMFNECSNLEYINLSSFDTTNVTDMSYMFNKCYNLKHLNLLNFNTKNVRNKTLMFGDCKNLLQIDLSSFITKKEEDASEMFKSPKRQNTYRLNKNKTKDNKLKDIYKVIFVGESGIGAKTTLINILMGLKYKESICSTSVCCYSQLKIKLQKNKEITLNLWDTIGQEKFRSLTKLFMNDLDCVVIGYDITQKNTFEEAKRFWYKMVRENNLCDLVYFIGNKIDLYQMREVDSDEAINFAKHENIRLFEISCKNYTGINKFLDDLVYNLTNERKLK